MNDFDKQYFELAKRIIYGGTDVFNERTGKKCKTVFGHMMRFDLSTGKFPLLTSKRIAYKSMVGELLAFFNCADNAATFRKYGCKFWDANANESKDWLANPNRRGTDDLGRIYGVQARDWRSPTGDSIDQLAMVVEKLNRGLDDRRLVVTHWNPGEMDQMALPPCHMLYMFGLDGNGKLNMCMLQRSADVPLGVPMNIASYALTLAIIAKITGYEVGEFVYFIWNAHIYEDQMEPLIKQLINEVHEPPTLKISDTIQTLEDLKIATVDDFQFIDYKHSGDVKFPFSA